MPDGSSLEWFAKGGNIILSKPDNTHIHYSPTGGVSIFLESSRRAPQSFMSPDVSVNNIEPLLHFNTFQGTLAVRPSRKAPSSKYFKEIKK